MKNQAFVYEKSNKLFVHTVMTNNKPTSFGEWLRDKIKENDISNAELARRVEVSPTYIGNLLRDFSPNSKTGSIRASEKIVEAIAKALHVDIDEARLAAGYAPQVDATIETIEFDKNVRLQLLGAKNFSEEDKKEFAESFQVAYEIAKRRIAEKRKINE